MDKILRRNKRGDKILSVYWFLIIFIVSGAVIYMASLFYGAPYDVRMIESKALSDQIANCMTHAGFLSDSVFSPAFQKNFMKDCHLNFSVENSYGWTNRSEYYVEVGVYDYDNGTFNLLGKKDAGISEGNPNLKSAWQILASGNERAPSGFLAGIVSSASNLLSGKRKVDTIVIHTTEGSSASGAIETIADRSLSVHYMIDRNGHIYSSANPPAQYASAFVPENQAASHAGCGVGNDMITSCSTLPASSGCTDKSPVNSNGILDPKCQNLSNPPTSEQCCVPGYNANSIGIELVNLGHLCTGLSGGFCKDSMSLDGYKWENFSNSPQQMDSLVNLVADIALRYKIPVDRDHIIGHYQIATRKTDPGPNFPWDQFLAAVKDRESTISASEQSSQSKNLPQGQLRSFYAIDKNGKQYIIQVLAIVGKTEKNA